MNKKNIIFISTLCLLLLFTDCTRRRKETSESRSRTGTEQRSATRSSRSGESVVKMTNDNNDTVIVERIINNITITNTSTNNTTYNQNRVTNSSCVNVDNTIKTVSSYTENNTINNICVQEENNANVSVQQDNSTNTRIIQQQAIQQIDY